MVESQIQHSTSERVDYLPGVYDYSWQLKFYFAFLFQIQRLFKQHPSKQGMFQYKVG